MTGAPVPEGADAVVMVEHVELRGWMRFALMRGRSVRSGENIVPRGSEARAGEVVLPAGTVIEGAEIALAAACGLSALTVFRRPRVAIVATGDELVELDADAGAAADSQLEQLWAGGAGGRGWGRGGAAADRARPARGAGADDSAGATAAICCCCRAGSRWASMTWWRRCCATLGAEFFFTGVKMQPGKPVVFGQAACRADGFPAQFFFGLPGNPVSTQVTFHCFVEPLLRAMGGAAVDAPRFAQATLAEDVAGKAGTDAGPAGAADDGPGAAGGAAGGVAGIGRPGGECSGELLCCAAAGQGAICGGRCDHGAAAVGFGRR